MSVSFVPHTLAVLIVYGMQQFHCMVGAMGADKRNQSHTPHSTPTQVVFIADTIRMLVTTCFLRDIVAFYYGSKLSISH